MKNLRITISNKDFKAFKFENEQITFAELLKKIQKNITRKNLIVAVEASKKNGLSKMTMEEISEEVKAVRQSK